MPNLLVSASADVKVWDLMSVTSDKNTNEIETPKAVPEQLLGVEVASFAPNDTSTAVNVARWSHDSKNTHYFIDQYHVIDHELIQIFLTNGIWSKNICFKSS
jgi:hypothetical protein